MRREFNKIKNALIAEIVACEDESLLEDMLADLKRRKAELVSKGIVQNIEAYRKAVRESIDDYKTGRYSTIEEANSRFLKRDLGK